MSQERVALLNRGVVGTGALVAFVLLVSFYFVVSGAVTRAANKRADWSNAVSEAGPASMLSNSMTDPHRPGAGVSRARAAG